jgi:hypothetical protein
MRTCMHAVRVDKIFFEFMFPHACRILEFERDIANGSRSVTVEMWDTSGDSK